MDGLTGFPEEERGNFRLLERLLAQAARIAWIIGLSVLTAEAVSAARENLVIGQ